MNELDLIEIPKTYYLNFNSLNGKPGWIKQQQIFRDKPFYTYTHYGLPNSSLIHNETGPAIIADDGRKEWWQNNELHRLDGPARIYKDRYKIFLINDDMFSEEEYWCHPLVVQNTIKKILEL